jgi:flagellar biosynthesis protein FlhB
VGSREGKTEAPTERKKKQSRKKGQAAKSQDLSAWITLLAGSYIIPSTVVNVGKVMTDAFNGMHNLASAPSDRASVTILGDAMWGGLLATLPLLAICMMIGVVSHFAQSGLVLSLHPLKPDFKRLNPIKGAKNLFSPKSVWETIRQTAKAAIVGFLAWPHVQAISRNLTEHGRVSLLEGIAMSGSELVAMIRAACYAILAVSVVDYAIKKRNHRKDLMMTKQEVREEMRQSEGDPQMKGKIRSMQVSLSRNRMMASVPSATVVITNPTHIAVAIRYDPKAGGAPKLVAAGIGAVAAKIRERAREAGVPIVQSKPLARALYRVCEVGDEIPVELYEALAKVLAFIRRLRGGILAASALPLPPNYDVAHEALEALQGRPNRRRPAA